MSYIRLFWVCFEGQCHCFIHDLNLPFNLRVTNSMPSFVKNKDKTEEKTQHLKNN